VGVPLASDSVSVRPGANLRYVRFVHPECSRKTSSRLVWQRLSKETYYNANYTSAYDQRVRKSRNLLSDLRRQITERETELKRLHDEEHRLDSLVSPGPATRVGRPTRGSRRTDWQAVLGKLELCGKVGDDGLR
jgi:hypothetical protein